MNVTVIIILIAIMEKSGEAYTVSLVEYSTVTCICMRATKKKIDCACG
jgi:hypothetical protein